MKRVQKVFTLGKTRKIEEKRIKPNVIRRRVVQPSVGESMLLLIQTEASIKTDARKEGAAETVKTNNSKLKEIMHKGGISS